MKFNLHKFVAVAGAAVILILSIGVRADVITDWNAIAVSATAVPPGRPGPSMVLDMAAVHGAMYDAVQAIEGDYQPYCGAIPGASGSPEAAAASAAYEMLVNRFPAQAGSLTTTYNNYLLTNSISPLDAGVAVGASAANCIIA